MSDEAVRTENLTKVYKDFLGRPKVTAVEDLNLTIHRGEILGLVGPNGSGKTTITKLLLGLLFPTRGTVTVLGRPATDVAKNQRIGFLPEESYLYRFLNAEETLDFYGRLFHLPRAERRRRIDELLERVGLQQDRKRRLKEYSKGMSRRIGLAQALINDPELIILDEPTTGLDPIGTRQFKDLIRRLGDEGKTVLLCSHLLAQVESVCDRIAMLVRGRLCQVGRVRDLLAIRDAVQVTARQVPEAALADLRKLLEQAGGRDITVEHPTETLEDLFLDTVRQDASEADDAARTS